MLIGEKGLPLKTQTGINEEQDGQLVADKYIK
jgi:hypothetical protein